MRLTAGRNKFGITVISTMFFLNEERKYVENFITENLRKSLKQLQACLGLVTLLYLAFPRS